MALTRAAKEQILDDYQKGLATADAAFLMDYRGITVPNVSELRKRVREHGGSYQVVKNRLALRAIKGSSLEPLTEHFEGPTAIAYGSEDVVGLAKVLTDFAKEVPSIEFKGGLVEGRTVGPEEIKQLASLPSREELLAKLFFLMKSPVTGLVQTLGAIPQQFVSVLEQVRQKRDEAG